MFILESGSRCRIRSGYFKCGNSFMTLMSKAQPVNYRFQEKSKFALLTLNNVYTDLPAETCQLPDGTWIMPGLPVPDLGIWKEWLGSIRVERLGSANLVLILEEPSDNSTSLDDVHQRLTRDLHWLFQMLHLRAGIEMDSADLLCGSSVNGVPEIRQMSQMPDFYQSNGYTRAPITQAWLEDGLVLRAGIATVEADKKWFRRVIRGLNTLIKGLKETGQDRLHQFVRSLEALILPEIGRTKTQFAHRCQTFARASDDTRALLLEAFEMRSDTEHLNPWDKAVEKKYPSDECEDVCWHRTRQIEHLACDAYSRLLHDPDLRKHFQTEDAIAAFWNLPDSQRSGLWSTPLDIAREPFVQEYDPWGRAHS